MKLNEIEDELSETGFAIREGNLHELERLTLLDSRWHQTEHGKRRLRNKLQPKSQDEAPKNSLSSIYGLEDQPLHTDGAHLKQMPDVVVLTAEAANTTPTLVWKLPPNIPSAVYHGVFTVRTTERSFLALAYNKERLRYDPGCMVPADHLAGEVEAYFEAARAQAYVHNWSVPNELLFIDNRRALHARNAIMSDVDRATRVLHRLVYRLEEE